MVHLNIKNNDSLSSQYFLEDLSIMHIYLFTWLHWRKILCVWHNSIENDQQNNKKILHSKSEPHGNCGGGGSTIKGDKKWRWWEKGCNKLSDVTYSNLVMLISPAIHFFFLSYLIVFWKWTGEAVPLCFDEKHPYKI